PTDFVVVDFESDPRVPLILRRSFLRTGRALIDVYGEEIILRVDNEAVTFNLDQTTRYSSTNDKSVGNGYSQKDEKQSQKQQTDHGMEKVKSRGFLKLRVKMDNSRTLKHDGREKVVNSRFSLDHHQAKPRRKMDFALIAITKEAHMSLSRIAKLAIRVR
ncbi:hypothetical protein Tco_1497277, partial [Tanacetum coccineum]